MYVIHVRGGQLTLYISEERHGLKRPVQPDAMYHSIISVFMEGERTYHLSTVEKKIKDNTELRA